MNFFLLFIAISCILTAGCITPETTPENSPVTAPTTESSPVPTTEPPTPSDTVPEAAQFTRDDVYELLMDIAFGCDNTGVTMFSPSSENHLFFSLEGQVIPADIGFVSLFTREVASPFTALLKIPAFTGLQPAAGKPGDPGLRL